MIRIIPINPTELDQFFNSDRLELANTIVQITKEDLEQVKREIYTLAYKLDAGMNQRAFLIACYGKVYFNSLLLPNKYNAEELAKRLFESIGNRSSTLFEDEKVQEILHKINECVFLATLKKIFDADVNEEIILQYFNLITDSTFQEHISFSWSLLGPTEIQSLTINHFEKMKVVLMEKIKRERTEAPPPLLDGQETQENDDDQILGIIGNQKLIIENYKTAIDLQQSIIDNLKTQRNLAVAGAFLVCAAAYQYFS